MPTDAPILIAHRGYAKRYPENTLVALEAAFEAGACCVEFDVQFTSDGVPVLLHDANLKRTTGTNKRIFSLDAKKLGTLVVNEAQQQPARFTDVGIPTLAAAIELLQRWPHVRAFVEVKQESLDTIGIEKVVKKVAQICAPVIDRCVLIAYDILSLRCGRAMGFEAVGWILKRYDEESLSLATELAPDYLICNHTKLPKDIESLWQGPWQWAFYEVTQPRTALKLAELGADYIETMAVAEMLKNRALRSRSCIDRSGL